MALCLGIEMNTFHIQTPLLKEKAWIMHALTSTCNSEIHLELLENQHLNQTSPRQTDTLVISVQGWECLRCILLCEMLLLWMTCRGFVVWRMFSCADVALSHMVNVSTLSFYKSKDTHHTYIKNVLSDLTTDNGLTKPQSKSEVRLS